MARKLNWIESNKITLFRLGGVLIVIGATLMVHAIASKKVPEVPSEILQGSSQSSDSATNSNPPTTTQPATPTPTPTTSKQPAAPAAPAITVSQRNAVSKAKEYLSVEAFSHDGLIDQLEYDQFSAADATYGADNSNGDWNAQAAKKAQEYMSTDSFSRQELIDQLEYDKFTPDQATYGVNAVGL